jgi:CRP-like cAMP-binding protein
MSGSGFYVILDGEATVTLGGEELNRLRQGDFFGEISTLLDEPLTADVTAETPVRVLEIPGPRLEAFLLSYPKVMLRMLVTEARRLQEVLAWRS